MEIMRRSQVAGLRVGGMLELTRQILRSFLQRLSSSDPPKHTEITVRGYIAKEVSLTCVCVGGGFVIEGERTEI